MKTPKFPASEMERNTLSDIGRNFFYQIYHNQPSQTAREPNAVNLKMKEGSVLSPFGAHSNLKNPETMQILNKEMEKRRDND